MYYKAEFCHMNFVARDLEHVCITQSDANQRERTPIVCVILVSSRLIRFVLYVNRI